MKETPPEIMLRFLRWFCKDDYIEEIEGDLTELFEEQAAVSPAKAKRLFFWSVVRYFRPAFIKSFPIIHFFNPVVMLRHNLLTALRNFKRNRTSFAINVFGLSLGIACAFFIYLWVDDERNINHYNKRDEQLYQVMVTYKYPGGIGTGEGTMGPLADAMATDLPEVENAVTVVPASWFSSNGGITYGDIHLSARPQFVSNDYLKVFTCDLLHGDNKNILPDKTSVVMSDELAMKLFHTTENLEGKIVKWNHGLLTDTYHVTGIFKKRPANDASPFDLLFSFDQFKAKRDGMQYWGNSDPSTFLLLKKGTDVTAFNAKIKTFVQTKDPENESMLFVQRYSDRYLHGTYVNGRISGGRIRYVELLSTIGVFILVIACINFMNLSTAKATRRSKEVGVRKTAGASRWTLITQYLSESAFITFISLAVSMGIVILFLPYFNIITDKHLVLKNDISLYLSIGSIWIVTSLLAGSYPAFYLSGFQAASILKGRMSNSFGELLARKGLVVFQFAVSVILIVAVWVVNAQMNFIQNTDLGYSKENIISLEMTNTPIERLESFQNELRNVPGVVSAAAYGHTLSGDHGAIELDWDGKNQNQKMNFANLEVGYNFIETMGIEFKEGHSFTYDASSQNQIVINQAAVDFMGMKDPVGKTVRFWGNERKIVGVTKNFNFESLHSEIKPCFFQVYPVMFNFVVRIEHGKERATIEGIHKVYDNFAEGYPFDFRFLDETYAALYASEQRVSVLSRYFAGIAIMISSLGLFGLAAFTAEKRTKEIGIRKVMGSSDSGIVYLLSADFTKTVLISIAIALPVSYFIINKWLSSFAFRTALEWWYFAGAGMGALIVAWITVGVNTIRAAKGNPVQALGSQN